MSKKLTPEERLLRAIYGNPPELPKVRCTKCGKEVDNPIYLNGQPYHYNHLPNLRR